MAYRDELEAAQHRIAELENKVHELEGAGPPPSPGEPPPPRRRTGVLFGIPLVVIAIASGIALGQPVCGRACGAMTGSTEPALRALRACPRARQLLGDDVGWGTIGCANCESESGGDPFNGGCHSSSSWEMPVSGSRGRGSYSWSFSQPPGKEPQLTGGRVTMSTGESIAITPDGCP